MIENILSEMITMNYTESNELNIDHMFNELSIAL